uniref:Putative nicotinic acetylcholine receptor 1 n=1 Tax=Hirudo verbana TaxID=311461 RepID=A0A2S1WLU5_9ANNE|nr:putative nicotinic acetylcholine receptor 1 [Hirudo verbana]
MEHYRVFLVINFFFRNPYIDALLQSGLGSEDEVRLVQKLFLEDGYNPLIRPVKNLNDTVIVKFGMAMIQLINVDEKNQIMKSNVWLRMLWKDYQLEWDPSDFGGINVIRTLPDKVWKPDIVLFNNADGKYEVSYKPNVVIFSNGEVMWIPPAIFKSSCTIDVKYFPFDQQRCEMKFGSWTFNGDQVVLDWYEGQEKVDLSDYVNSGTWDVINCPGQYNYTYDFVEKHSKAQITFFLFIRRKTLFYTVNLIIPCVLISFLSVCVFYLPADAGEKMTMCISILLALVVFLLLVSKILPPTSVTIPLIAKYLLFTFIMNIVTILITVIIINWNFKTPRTHRMPRWVRVVFLNYLPKFLLMKRPHHEERWSKKAYSRRNRPSIRPELTLNPDPGSTQFNTEQPFKPLESHEMENFKGRGELRSGHVSGREGATSFYEASSADVQIPNMSTETQKAIDAVRFIAAHLKNEDDYAEILEDWRYIAMVIDRLQLYIFVAVTIGGTVGILISAPHIFEFVDQDEIKRNILGSITSDNTGL